MKKLILAALLCLAPSLTFGQARYETHFLKTLPAGGVTAFSGATQVCTGAGLAVTSGSITSNIATLTMTSSPLTAGFVNGHDVLIINFAGNGAFMNNASFTMTSVTSTQIQFSVTHADVGSTGTGAALMKPSTLFAGCAPIAAVYSDQALTVQLNSGGATFPDDGSGNVRFFAAPGSYWLSYQASAAQPYMSFITMPLTPNASGVLILNNVTIDCTLNTLAKNPCIVYSTASASTNASIGAVTMATASGSGNTYRLSSFITQTVLGSGCSTNTLVTLRVDFTDPNASASGSLTLVNFTITNNGALGVDAGVPTIIVRAKAGTVVQYDTTLTPGTCTTVPSYQIYPVLELVN